jgi:hypothetical protein
MKQTNLHSIKMLSPAIAATITIIIGFGITAFTVTGQTTQGTAAAKPNPMKKSDIVKALESNAISSKELAERIKLRGVDFELNDKSEEELSNAGAGKEVIEAVRASFQSTPKKKGMFEKLTDSVGKATDRARESVSKTAGSKEENPQPTESVEQEKRTYNVGDRVEADPIGLQMWRKGTVIKVWRTPAGSIGGYVVRMDDEKEYTGGAMEHNTHAGHLRPLNETAAEKQTQAAQQTQAEANVGKLRVDENNTVLADRELLPCDNLKQKPVRNGARPDRVLLDKVIRCIWERPAVRRGVDGAVTMDLTPLQISPPRKWRLRSDIGTDGTLDTDVYPVKTTYTLKTFYRERTVVDEYFGVFNCYVSTFGEWRCGMAESKRKGETRSIPVRQ